jgi:Fic family protein
MFSRSRVKKAHARFLESCRNLKEGRAYWDQASRLTRWFLEMITPMPILGLHPDGMLILKALEWLEANCHSRPLSEEVIRLYHRMVLGREVSAGSYRPGEMIVERSSLLRRVPPARIPVLMKELDARLRGFERDVAADKTPSRERLLRFSVEVHYRIVLIHPFKDANGRVARLALNHILRRWKQGYVILPPLDESREHWDALQAAHEGNLEPLQRLAQTHLYPL